MKNLIVRFLFSIILISSSSLFPQTFWQQSNGPNQGTIHSITFNSHGEAFIGTTPGGIYRSPDYGLNWFQTSVDSGSVFCILAAPNGNIIAGGERNYVSTDNGYTWQMPQLLVNWMNLQPFYCLAESPSGLVYAGVMGGVYKSADGGLTFDTTLQINMGIVNTICVNASGHVFVGTAGEGLYRSTDEGANWDTVMNGLGSNMIHDVAVNRTTGELYALTYSDEGDIYRSTDNGDSWVSIVPEGSDFNGSYCLMVTPAGHIFTSGWGFVMRTSDNGVTWNPGNVYYRGHFTDIARNSAGIIFACSDEAGVFRSDDNGNTWMPASNQLPLTTVSCLATNSQNHIYAGTEWNGLWRSMDNGDTWDRMGLTSHILHCVTVAPNGYVYAGTYTDWWHEGGLFRSTNNGASWQRFELENEVVTAAGYNSSGHVFASTYAKIYRSVDNGDTWGLVWEGMSTGYNQVIVQAPDGTMFMGGDWGIYKSTDNGATWSSTVLYGDGKFIRSVTFDPSGNVVAGGKGIWKTTDNGTTWTDIQEPGEQDIYNVIITPGGDLYAASMMNNGAVWRTKYDNINWQVWTDGLKYKRFGAFAMANNGYLYLGAAGRSVYRTRYTTTDSESEETVPGEFNLSQNYPNPFNPTTVISYQLPVSSHVTMKLFDVLGNELAVLVDAMQEAGNHNYQLSTVKTKLSSGTYFYQLRAGELVETRKMILLK